MAERKVNLRVSALDGGKMKAELRSIGKEGQHALSMIEGDSNGATRGLHATGLAANELMNRLTAVAARAAQAANSFGAVATSGTSTLARVNAATGVTGGMARDSADIQAYGRAMDDLRAKMNPLFAEMQRHEGAVAEIDRAWKVGAISLDEWVSATRREEAANAEAANSIRQRQAAFENFVNTGLRDSIDALNGVSGDRARSAEDIEAYGRAMDDVRAKLSPLFAEERRHADSMAEIDRAYKTGAISLGEWEAATKREIAANERAQASLRARQAALDNMVNTSLRDSINANTGVSALPARATEDIEAYGRALDATRAKYNPMYAAISNYRTELAGVKAAHAAGAISADEMTAAISRLRRASLNDIGVIKGRVEGYQQMTKAGGMARFQMVQLGYQLNDIGVSLAGGQNPLLVMVQQGAQIAQIYGNGQGGVRALLSQTLGIFTKMPGPVKAFAAAIGIGAIAIKGMQAEINKTSKVAVTFGDTTLAVFQTIRDGIYSWIKPATDKISEWFDATWDLVAEGVIWLGNIIVQRVEKILLAFSSLPGVVGGEFQRMVDIAKAGYDGMVNIWGVLPDAIGDFAYKAANSLIDGVESMLNAVVKRVNDFIGKLNTALSYLPEWATGADGISIGTVGDISLGDVGNPYAGGAAKATDAAAAAAAEIAAAATQQNDAWEQYKAGINAIDASDPMGDFFDAVAGRAKENARKRLAEDDKSKSGSGKATKEKKKDEELSDLEEIMKALSDYSDQARDFGKQIGDALVGAFQSAEDAVMDFVETGTLDIKSLVTSIISDFARIGIRSMIMSPLSNLMSGLVGNYGSSLLSAFVQHTGGAAGSGATRQISAANFLHAPRLHSGTGNVSGLRSDEYAAILQRGERVLNRGETSAYESGSGQQMVVNFNGVRDAKSFRQSRTQIASDLSRAVAMGRRGI